MKLQNFMVLFVIVLLPIILITAYYMSLQIDTINMQTSYNAKLQQSTKSAIEAYEINTVKWNSSYSRTPDSQRRDVIASINTFTTAFANSMGVGGTSKETILSYVPAIAYTLYDGYYIYSPAKEKETIVDNNEVTVTMREELTMNLPSQPALVTGYIYNEDDKGKILYVPDDGVTPDGFYDGNGFVLDQTKAKESDYKHILKPFSTYSQTYRYKHSTGNKVIINYTLDNYIRVYGDVPKETGSGSGFEYGYKEGYLTTRVNLSKNGTIDGIKYQADAANYIDIKPEQLKEFVYYTGLAEPKEFTYVYTSDKLKIYLDNTGETIQGFYLEGNKRVDISEGFSKYYKKCTVPLIDGSKYTYIELYQNLATGEWKEKNRNEEFREENLHDVEEDKLKIYLNCSNLNSTIYLDYSAVNYCVESQIFSNWFYRKILGYGESGSNSGLQYSSNGNYIDVGIIIEDDPENNTSTFDNERRRVIKTALINNLQQAITSYSRNSEGEYSLPVLSETDWDQILTNVSIVTFVQDIPIGMKYYNNYSIATSTRNDEYIDPNEIYLTASGDEFYHRPYCNKTPGVGTVKGYRNTDYVERFYDDSGTTKYYYPHAKNNESIQSCYYCMIQRELINTATGTKLIKEETAYCTALARERYVAKKIKLPSQIKPVYTINVIPVDETGATINTKWKHNGSEKEGTQQISITPTPGAEHEFVAISESPEEISYGILGEIDNPVEASLIAPSLIMGGSTYSSNGKVTVKINGYTNYNLSGEFKNATTDAEYAVCQPDAHLIKNPTETYNMEPDWTISSDVLHGYINVKLKYVNNYSTPEAAVVGGEIPVYANIDAANKLTIVTNLQNVTGVVVLRYSTSGNTYYSQLLNIETPNTEVCYYIPDNKDWYNEEWTVDVLNVDAEPIATGSVEYYTIKDDIGLKGFAEATNDTTDGYNGAKTEGRTFILLNNISVGNMNPICSLDTKPFKGILEGNNYNITDANIIGVTQNAGLFGKIDGGTIKDLAIKDIKVDLPEVDYIGGLAGQNISGTISNVTINNPTINGKDYVGGFFGLNTGNISGCIMEQGAAGKVTGQNGVGGFIGYNQEATFKNMKNQLEVIGTGVNVGGFVGYDEKSTFFRCDNLGNVTAKYCNGGIVGCGYESKIQRCTNIGTITATDCAPEDTIDPENYHGTGGIAGYFGGGYVYYSYNKGTINGSNNCGGICGGIIKARISCSYNVGTVNGTGMEVGGIAGSSLAYAKFEYCYSVGECAHGGIVGRESESGVGAIATYHECYFTKGKKPIRTFVDASDIHGVEKRISDELKNILYKWSYKPSGSGGIFNGTQRIYQTTAPIETSGKGYKGYGVLWWEIPNYVRLTSNMFICSETEGGREYKKFTNISFMPKIKLNGGVLSFFDIPNVIDTNKGAFTNPVNSTGAYTWEMMIPKGNYNIQGTTIYTESSPNYMIFVYDANGNKKNSNDGPYTGDYAYNISENTTLYIAPIFTSNPGYFSNKGNITVEWRKVDDNAVEAETSIFSDFYDDNANKIDKVKGFHTYDPGDARVLKAGDSGRISSLFNVYLDSARTVPKRFYGFWYWTKREAIWGTGWLRNTKNCRI